MLDVLLFSCMNFVRSNWRGLQGAANVPPPLFLLRAVDLNADTTMETHGLFIAVLLWGNPPRRLHRREKIVPHEHRKSFVSGFSHGRPTLLNSLTDSEQAWSIIIYATIIPLGQHSTSTTAKRYMSRSMTKMAAKDTIVPYIDLSIMSVRGANQS